MLEPGGNENQHRHDHSGRVRLGKIHPEETGAERRSGVDGEHGNPGVEFLRQRHQVVRPRVECLNQNPEQAEEDGHLDDQRPDTAHRTYPRLTVHAHCFLRNSGPVAPVAFLDLSHPGLEVHHGPHLAQLLDGERQRQQPDYDSEHNDGDAHVVEADGVQNHQQIQHGPYDNFPPEVAYQLQRTCLTTRACCPAGRSARGLPADSLSVASVVVVFRVPAPPLLQRTAGGGVHPSHAPVLRAYENGIADGMERGGYLRAAQG